MPFASFQTITARFACFQAQWLNVHVTFAAAAPRPAITVGAVRYPGSRSTTRASPSMAAGAKTS